VYQLEEYRRQQAFDRGSPAATTARPVEIWEGHTTNIGANPRGHEIDRHAD
jgi:hypothetical protein